MLILSSTCFLRRFPRDFLGSLRVPALSRAILGPYPGWSTVFSSISLRSVWKCRCQTFNVLVILLGWWCGCFSTLNRKILDQNCSLKRVNCCVMQYLSSPAFVSSTLAHGDSAKVIRICFSDPLSV